MHYLIYSSHDHYPAFIGKHLKLKGIDSFGQGHEIVSGAAGIGTSESF